MEGKGEKNIGEKKKEKVALTKLGENEGNKQGLTNYWGYEVPPVKKAAEESGWLSSLPSGAVVSNSQQ